MLKTNQYINNSLGNLEKLPIDFFESYRPKPSEEFDILVIGDSWFNYPLILKDITDFLSLSYKTYIISTTENFNQNDYLEELTEKLNFLPKSKCIILSSEIYYLFMFELNSLLDKGAIDFAEILKIKRLSPILNVLQKILISNTPLIIHGYEYLPIQSKNNWLHSVYQKIGSNNENVEGKNKEKIDKFNDLLKLAVINFPNLHYLDIRDTLSVDDWYDEIHPNNEGFRKLSEKFKEKIEELLSLKSTKKNDHVFINLLEKKILWVYDDPYNDSIESIIKILIEKNYTVDHVYDSETAFKNLGSTEYDLIISDMRRGNDPEAGMNFLIEFKKLKKEIPFVIYTTKNNVEKYESSALRNGAYAIKTGTWQNMSEYILELLHILDNQESIKPFNSKWVLIAGTGTDNFSEKERIMCVSLGKYLAQNGYGIKCGGWPGVDEEISKSFLHILNLNNINPEERLVQVFDHRLGNSFRILGKAEFVTGDQDWDNVALHNADAFIMIGGKGGTYELYEKALTAKLLIIPIPATGGDSKKVYDIITHNNLEVLNKNEWEIDSKLLSKLDMSFESEVEADKISLEIINILSNILY